MAERPILFNDPMVRAILSGAKTQTRRPVKPQPDSIACEDAFVDAGIVENAWVTRFDGGLGVDVGIVRCPFGDVGDTLWVRECFALGRVFDEARAAELPIIERDIPLWYRADGNRDESWANRGKWRPSIHTPRWASRILLRVTGVRVERLQDITEADAKAEGSEPATLRLMGGDPRQDFRVGFASLWSAVYGPESWEANPWVWAVGFDLVRGVAP